MELDARKLSILKVIIEDYIATAAPVGSRSIAKHKDIQLSSATIRNEMSDLEELGYLVQPHTSAGRMPSSKAYRFYVDQLMKTKPLKKGERKAIHDYAAQTLRKAENLIGQTAKVLAEITQYPSMVMAPQWGKLTIRRVQLIDVGANKLLIIIVTAAGTVHDKLIPVSEQFSSEQLDRFSQAMSERFIDYSIEEAVDILSNQFQAEISRQRAIFESILTAIQQESEEKSRDRNMAVSGVTNLLMHPEYSDIEKARAMLAMLEKKDKLVELFEQPMNMKFSIRIGPENECEEMQDSSIVTATYRINGIQEGVFGIIGPTRMDYQRILWMLNSVGQCMEEIFSTSSEQDQHEE